ncbi:MAG: DUF5615 family PIN-like protein [Planctomycetota bacterium]|nr:DUF5615 family PIN-like protein [Planctomycetota bacterium]
MRFLVDESTGPTVARWLVSQGHEVWSVYEHSRGITDEEVLRKAHAEDWILITNDKDFGEKVFRERMPHKGVVLLRLDDERAANAIGALTRLLAHHAGNLRDHFVVVTDSQVRFAKRT